MKNKIDQLAKLAKEVQLKDEKDRRKTTIFIVSSILFGLIWVGFSYYQVDQLRKRKVELEQQLLRYEKRIDSLFITEQGILTFFNKIISEPNFSFVDLDVPWERIIESAMEETTGKRKSAIMIATLLSYRRVRFNLDGGSLTEGFSSPDFVNYILGILNLKIEQEQGVPLSETMMQNFIKTNSPKPGDLIFYKGEVGNFCFFYLGEGKKGGKGIGIGTVESLSPYIVMDTDNLTDFYKKRFIGFFHIKY